MLTILLDPAGITGRQRHEWDLGATLQDNISRHLGGGADCDLRINGELVDPLADHRLDAPPQPADQVTVTRRPAGFETWVYIAMAASFVVSYALMPRMPGTSAAGKDSPNNSLTGQTNTARAYQAIPDVYGYRRVWPDLIQPSTVEYIGGIKYVTEWLCVSRGKGTISAVQYADTPIGDIAGASYEVFEPTPIGGYPELGATNIADVLETFASDEVNGQEVSYPAQTAVGALAAVSAATTFTATLPDDQVPSQLRGASPSDPIGVTFSHLGGTFNETCTLLSYAVDGLGNCTLTFTSAPWGGSYTEADVSFTFDLLPAGLNKLGPFTLPAQADRLRWNTVFQRGLRGTVVIRAEWWKIDGDGVEVPGTREYADTTYKDSTYDQRAYTTQAEPTAGNGRYRIQFVRQTPEIGSSGTDVAKLEEVYAVRHYASKVLPGVTVIRVTTKATADATGFSDRKFNLRWLRHVRGLRTETIEPSRNFARAIAHVWTIAGNDIAGLDVEALAQVNNDLGNDSPLLRFDCSLDDADMSLGERMQLIANTARCVIWRDGLRWTITRDQARTYPELQLDYRNLAAGGESAISYAAHLPASNDGVEIEYVDEDTQAKKAYYRLNISTGEPIEGVSNNPLKVRLPGCVTLDQAINRGQLEARRLLYQRVSVSDTALADGLQLYPGALVRWIDPNDFGGDDGLQAGEVMRIEPLPGGACLIATSEPIDWAGETEGRMLFTGADGRNLGAPVPCYPDGAAVRLASVPLGLYVADENRQLGSRYAFAVGLTADEIEASGLYTVTEAKPGASGTVSLACVNYDARTYAFD